MRQDIAVNKETVMEATNDNKASETEKRPEVMKVLGLLEAGTIGHKEALAMIAVLEGRKVVGGADGIISGADDSHAGDGTDSPKKRGKHLVGAIVALALLGAFVYGIFIYLPVHATKDSLALVYGLFALVILCGTLVAVSALGVGRLAVRLGTKKQE
jgi:hypothetical protein